jgi:tRNA modification GTPase
MFFKQLFKYKTFERYSSTLTTIFALATGQQVRSGVAIIRVSGLLAKESLLKLTRETKIENFQPNKLYLKKIYHYKTNDLIDQCMTVWFKGPKSFTGEDVVEL